MALTNFFSFQLLFICLVRGWYQINNNQRTLPKYQSRDPWRHTSMHRVAFSCSWMRGMERDLFALQHPEGLLPRYTEIIVYSRHLTPTHLVNSHFPTCRYCMLLRCHATSPTCSYDLSDMLLLMLFLQQLARQDALEGKAKQYRVPVCHEYYIV